MPEAATEPMDDGSNKNRTHTHTRTLAVENGNTKQTSYGATQHNVYCALASQFQVTRYGTGSQQHSRTSLEQEVAAKRMLPKATIETDN